MPCPAVCMSSPRLWRRSAFRTFSATSSPCAMERDAGARAWRRPSPTLPRDKACWGFTPPSRSTTRSSPPPDRALSGTGPASMSTSPRTPVTSRTLCAATARESSAVSMRRACSTHPRPSSPTACIWTRRSAASSLSPAPGSRRTRRAIRTTTSGSSIRAAWENASSSGPTACTLTPRPRPAPPIWRRGPWGGSRRFRRTGGCAPRTAISPPTASPATGRIIWSCSSTLPRPR